MEQIDTFGPETSHWINGPSALLGYYRPLLTRGIKQIAALNRKIELLPCCCPLHGYIIDYSEQWLHSAQPSPAQPGAHQTMMVDTGLHCLDTRGSVHFIWSFLLVICLPNVHYSPPILPIVNLSVLVAVAFVTWSPPSEPSTVWSVGVLSTNNQQWAGNVEDWQYQTSEHLFVLISTLITARA